MNLQSAIIIVIFSLHQTFSKHAQERKGKFWPSTIARFENSICSTLEGFLGTCYTRRECRNFGGIGSGMCESGAGTCCLFQATCGESSAYNNTYFVNPGYPDTYTEGAACTFTIKKCSPDICQARIDFLNLNLAQPDGEGNCVYDALIITGGASNVPIICGENSGQHVYVNFNGESDIRITITTSATFAYNRAWNIKVSQIGCDCPTLAPSGCLMHYTSLTGTVNSFNYGTTINGAVIQTPVGLRPGTRQIANTNYGVCVQMLPGYCSIRWMQAPGPTSFTVTGNTALLEVIGPLPSEPETNCTTDFVVIPNDTVDSDRFCGNQFLPLTTSSKPFVMTVVTDGGEQTGGQIDIANRGFSLQYTQIPCTGTQLTQLG